MWNLEYPCTHPKKVTKFRFKAVTETVYQVKMGYVVFWKQSIVKRTTTPHPHIN